MSAALLTATLTALAGLGTAIYLGQTATSAAVISRHITIGIFGTLIVLLAHSMTMFYLMG